LFAGFLEHRPVLLEERVAGAFVIGNTGSAPNVLIELQIG
jgi:hypothetical protein